MSWILQAVVDWYRDEDGESGGARERAEIARDLAVAVEKENYTKRTSDESFDARHEQTCFFVVAERSRWDKTGCYSETPLGTRLFSSFPAQYVAHETFAHELATANISLNRPASVDKDCTYQIAHETIAATNRREGQLITSTTHAVYLVFLPDFPLASLYRREEARIRGNDDADYDHEKLSIGMSSLLQSTVNLRRPIDKNTDFFVEVQFGLPTRRNAEKSPLTPYLYAYLLTKERYVERLRALGCRTAPDKIILPQ